MFTGIVEELGHVRRRVSNDAGAPVQSAERIVRFEIDASVIVDGLRLGDSVAHNGVCLTVVAIDAGGYAVDAVEETLRRSNLGDLAPGDPVNLERPLRLDDRVGGHLVQGHVDGTGEVVSAAPHLRVRVDPEIARYLVPKGSVTVDGCSLTVVDVVGDEFSVAIIPHTAAVTTLGLRRPGDRVNLEVDMLAKYVEKLLVPHSASHSASHSAPHLDRS